MVLTKNEEQILALERITDSPRTENRSTVNRFPCSSNPNPGLTTPLMKPACDCMALSHFEVVGHLFAADVDLIWASRVKRAAGGGLIGLGVPFKLDVLELPFSEDPSLELTPSEPLCRGERGNRTAPSLWQFQQHFQDTLPLSCRSYDARHQGYVR